MNRPKYHILVCNSFRTDGTPKGMCHKKDATSLLQHLEQEISDRGLDALITSAGCLKQCEQGPVMVLYPSVQWYGNVDQDKLDEILDAIEDETVVEDYLI